MVKFKGEIGDTVADTKNMSELVSLDLFEKSKLWFVRAINYFESDIETSIICFATALELILKSLIAREHWALLCLKGDKDVNLEALKNRNMTTVSFNDCLDLLIRIRPGIISPNEQTAYKDVSSHRNKIIHFTHPDIEKEKVEI